MSLGDRARSLSWLERAVLGGLVALFVWRGLIPAWTALNTDFPNYYLAARLFRGGFPLERLYDWVWLQRQKDHAGITEQPLVGYIPLTFFSALVVAPFSSLPPLAAKHCWLAVNVGLLCGTGHLLCRMTRLGWVRVLLIVFLAVVPLRTNFQFGQQHLLLCFVLALAAWLDARQRPALSGAMLAVAASLKLYPALFGIYLVRKRNWRALAGLLLTSAILGLIGLRLFGFGPLRDYVLDIIPRGLRGENNDPYTVVANSPTALLRRLFVREPELNPRPLLDAPLAFAALQPLAQALILVPGLWLVRPGRGEPKREQLEWASYLALLLTLSSASATYHFCVLIVAVALAADYLFDLGRDELAWGLIALHAAVCFPFYRFVPDNPSGWMIFAGFPRLYAVLALWCVFLRVLWVARAAEPRQNARREAALFGLLFLALVAGSVVSNVRHMKGQAESYLARVPRTSATLLATTPTVVRDVIYFARMDDGGSVIDRTGPPLLLHVTPGTELFHPTVTDTSPDGWMELSSTSSKVVRFPLAATELTVAALPVEVDDAEQPEVSRDGRWLAFLREDGHGRAVLHVLDRRPDHPGSPSDASEHAVAGALPDVLDMGFFPDDRIVLAAVDEGRSRLFVGDPVGGRFVEIAASERPQRYPAVSPDGRWLAFSREEHGKWQLWLANTATGDTRPLTEGDCNATLPAWSDSNRIVYATDCGRGLAHTALSTLTAVP